MKTQRYAGEYRLKRLQDDVRRLIRAQGALEQRLFTMAVNIDYLRRKAGTDSSIIDLKEVPL
jgi:hypothetical protein